MKSRQPGAVLPLALALLSLFALTGCATQDIHQAHRGRMFDRTGPLAFFSGGRGFTGPVLGPGTHFVGLYDEIRMVDCSMVTRREQIDVLTRDGVHFGFHMFIRFAADCNDRGVIKLLGSVAPDKDGTTITSNQLYTTYVHPVIGEVVRQIASPYRATEIHEKQGEILIAIRKRFTELMREREGHSITLHEVNLSHLDYPTELDHANVERAVQSILRDKAIAERVRVQAEIETMTLRRQLVEKEAETVGARIDRIGAALRRNPEYVQFELQTKLPDIYREAGARGNLVLAAPNPVTWISAPGASVPRLQPTLPAAPPPPALPATPAQPGQPPQGHFPPQ